MSQSNIITICVCDLGILKPYNISIKARSNKHADAEYRAIYKKGRLVSHDIRIYMGNAFRSLNTLIVHELIHAWQEENGVNEIHGKDFRYIARELSKKYKLPDIYIPGVDID